MIRQRAAIGEAGGKPDAVDEVLPARVHFDHARRRQVCRQRHAGQVRSVVSRRDIEDGSERQRDIEMALELQDAGLQSSGVGNTRVVVAEQRAIGGYRAEESDRPAILERSIKRQHLTQKLRID